MQELSELLCIQVPRKWHKKTLNYESMKRMLLQIEDANKLVDPEARNLDLTRLAKSLFECSKCEIKKSNQFYVNKLDEAKRAQAVLRVEFLRLRLSPKAPSLYTAYHILQLLKAHSQLYLELVQLKQFQNLNRIRIMRAMTKYDRLVGATAGVTYAKKFCAEGNLLSLHEINKTISYTEANMESLSRLLKEYCNTNTTFTTLAIVFVILVIFAVIIFRF